VGGGIRTLSGLSEGDPDYRSGDPDYRSVVPDYRSVDPDYPRKDPDYRGTIVSVI
jgi:hypothetical protein